MVMNGFLIVGSGISLIDNMWVITAGKVLYGIAAGGFTIYAPNYINEIVPTELKGPIACITNGMVAAGILAPFIFGLVIPDDAVKNLNSFYIQRYWRIIWSFPILLSLVQMALFLTVFRFDTPVELLAKKKKDIIKCTLIGGIEMGPQPWVNDLVLKLKARQNRALKI